MTSLNSAGFSFSNDLWDSFETICARLKFGSTFCRSYMKFFAEYVKETKEYAKKLKELTKTQQEEMGSMNLGWMAIKQEIESIANMNNRVADEISYKVIQPIETHLKETSRVKRKGKESGRKLIESIGESVKTISLAKTEYEKAMRIHDQSKSDYERASNFNEISNGSKLKKKLDADKKKAESMERKYRRAIDKGKILENRLFDSEMPEILSEFDQIERKRLHTIRNSIDAFRKTHFDTIPTIDSICKKMSVAIDAISPDGDVNDFIKEKRTGKDKNAQRIEFEPYSPQYKCCIKENGIPPSSSSSLSSISGDGSSPNLLMRSNTLSSSSSSPMITRSNTISGTDFMPSSLSSSSINVSDHHQQHHHLPNNNSPLSQSSTSAKALPINPLHLQSQNSNPQIIPIIQNNEQTNTNSVSTLSSSSPSMNNQTTNNAQVGASLSSASQNNVILDPRMSKSMSGVPVKEIGHCKALFDYEGSQPSELSFKKNDVITIYEKDASGWWVGEVRGKMGFFPSVDWVEEIQSPPSNNLPSNDLPPPSTPAPSPPPGKRMCKALFPMTAINANELNLREGDILTIEGEAEGWYFGTNQFGQSGMFPASFVSIVNQNQK